MTQTIAVIGSGPVGIEAAAELQARGHQVVVLEVGDQPAASMARWGRVRLFTPWSLCTSHRGRQLLGDPPELSSDTCPTGEELRQAYLLPLAQDLDLRLRHRVLEVGRARLRKGQELGRDSRRREPFRLLVDTPQGESFIEAQVVLDCSGTFLDPAPAGPGGLPALGERWARAAGLVRYGPQAVDDLGGRRVLLVGDGASAVTQLRALRSLTPPAVVTWLGLDPLGPGFASPADDSLPERAALFAYGRQALPEVDHRPGALVSSLEPWSDGLRVVLEDGERLTVDAAVVCTGFRPDHSLTRELQVHVCWGTEGPMKLAADLLATRGGGGGDCLAAPAGGGADVLRSPEPDLYVLGSKSYGRRSDFLLRTGHQQVAEVAGLIEASFPG